MCFSADAVRIHDRGRTWWRAGIEAALHTSVMALPLLAMLLWRSEAHGGQTVDWFNWKIKWRWIYSALRDRWKWFDIGSLVVPLLVFLYAIVSRKLTLSRNLAFSAIVLAIAFVMLPRIVFGSAYADMRLVPYLMAVMLLAIRFRGAPDRTTAQVLAVIGLLFFATRTVANTISLASGCRRSDGEDASDRLHAPRCAGHQPGRDDVQRILAAAAQRASGRHGHRPPRWILERSVAARGRQPARSQISPRRLFRGRPIAAGASQPLPRRASSADRPVAAHAAARRFRLCVADRCAALTSPATVSDMRLVWRGPGTVLYQTHP